MNTTASTTPAPGDPPGSIKTLLQELRAEGSLLIQKEAELAKTELSEKISTLGTRAKRLGIGGAIAYAGLLVALFGLGDLLGSVLVNAGMDATMAQWLARLCVGILVTIIGWIMFTRAKTAASPDTLVPEQTLRTLRENKQWMQNKLQHSHEPT